MLPQHLKFIDITNLKKHVKDTCIVLMFTRLINLWNSVPQIVEHVNMIVIDVVIQ